MAHQWLRLNLAAQFFPLLTELWGESIIIPQYDENYERTNVSPVDQGKDKGVPQVFYLHNCMPTSGGFQSINYDATVNPLLHTFNFDNEFLLQDPDRNTALFVPGGGSNYILNNRSAGWHSVSPFPIGTFKSDVLVTSAFVQGQTYIYYEKHGMYIYDAATDLMVLQVLVGINPATILGICHANGYMIAYTETDVAWSSQTNPLDFTPSLITGAGGGTVEDAEGNIVVGYAISGGFILYCERDAVGARYTGNAQFPYTLLEIPGSGAIINPQCVSWESNNDTHFAWTNQGLQTVSIGSTATSVFSEVTEFLAGRIYEDFDEDTLVLSQVSTRQQFNVKLNLISNQYMVISYGMVESFPIFSYCLIYDLNRLRWGKLKIDHACAFQWYTPGIHKILSYADLGTLPHTTYSVLIGIPYEDLLLSYEEYDNNSYASLYGTTYADLADNNIAPIQTINKELAFLQSDGTVYTVDFQLSERRADGVLILGKYQLQRNNWVEHQRTQVQNVKDTNTNFKCYIIPTLDGVTLETPQEAVLLETNPTSRMFGKRVGGLNYSLLFTGGFNLVSVKTDLTLGGQY